MRWNRVAASYRVFTEGGARSGYNDFVGDYREAGDDLMYDIAL
jgi:hypothetical protein